MRNNLVLVLYCADCGRPLEMPVNAAEKPQLNPEMSPPLPTGGLILKNEVSVYPCRACIEKHTGPAKQLAKAIKEFSEKDND